MRCPRLSELPPPPQGKAGWPWTEECQQLPEKMPDERAWPTVSIVTPSYNQAEYIEETIRSVLLQGYPNLDYIIIDGASIDNTLAIIREYENWLTHWVSEPDHGQSEAINKGWDRSEGEIVAWINSDDAYHPNAVKAAVETFATKADLGLVHGDCVCVDPSGVQLGVLKNGPVSFRRQMTGRNTILQPSTFFKRHMLDKVCGLDPELHYVMDYDLWVRMLLADCKTQYIPFVLSYYRLHGSAKSVAEQFRMRQEIKRVLDRIYENHEISDRFRRWEQTAYSNYHQSMGEAYFTLQQMDLARGEFWQSLRLHPIRPASVIVLAYILDTWLGTELGILIQQLRWRLPDVSQSSILWEDLMKDSWR